MTEVQDNPLGIDGFEFVEFAAPDAALLHSLFRHMGFTAVGRHRERKVTLYRQGDVNFLVNEEPDSFAADFARAHGPSACGFAIRVADAPRARAHAIDNGAAALSNKPATLPVRAPVVEGIGGSALYLVDRYGERGSIYDADFEYFQGVDRHPAGFGLTFIDHLTHNVYQGNMDKWAGFYERIFNFREIRYFDIKGEYTGLLSKALTAPDGRIRIPLNEEASKETGQIEEFLMAYNGEGIQHIALSCDDLLGCYDKLAERGMKFMTAPPDAYYEMLDERLPGHGEPVDELKSRGILLDGTIENDDPRLLLQIFSETLVGPVFFEFIQRKKDDGFGEGNFKALFESIERDQVARGVVGSGDSA